MRGLETTLVVGSLLWRLRDTVTGERTTVTVFFLFIMDKVSTNLISFWFNVITSNSAKVKRRWYQTEPENKSLLNESQGLGERSYLLQEIYILLSKYLPLQTMPLVLPQTMPAPKT